MKIFSLKRLRLKRNIYEPNYTNGLELVENNNNNKQIIMKKTTSHTIYLLTSNVRIPLQEPCKARTGKKKQLLAEKMSEIKFD